MKKLKKIIKGHLGEKKTASLKKTLHVARVIKNIVCWTLIAVLTLAVVVFMVTKVSGGTPSVFGYSLHRIVSGSMSPELEIGDVIACKKITDPSEIAVGDIITFKGDNRFDNQKVTHRVLVSPYDDGRGNIVLVTKGDANPEDDGEINFNDVESKCVKKVDFLKSIYQFFFSQWGLIVFVFLLLLVFFDEVVNIIRLTMARAEKDDSETIREIIERVKQEQAQRQLSEQSDETDIPDDSVNQKHLQEDAKATPENEDSASDGGQ